MHKPMCVEGIGVTYDPLFQLDNVRDMNYRTEKIPTDSANINNGHKYTYDANGNLVYINTSRVKKDGKEDEKATEQKYRWDEENRLLAADENGFVSNYWYDADGERTVKSSGENEAIYVNSEFSGGNTGTARFSLYVSPYLVAGQGGKYTKHIYIGSQRIVSKLGDLASYGADPRRIPYAGNEADGLTINYKDKYNQQLQSIKDNYKAFDQPYNGKDNDDYVNGQGFCCNDGTPEAAQARAMARTRAVNGNFKPNDDYEKMQFYYHPDHLGSSSYITNLDGEVSQHIEYVPFGEVFIEERNNTWNTPYLFNAKEFDEETGLYYYGARYYEPRLSLWMSADPLAEKYPNFSSYIYCINNPINLIDPKGTETHVVQNEDGSYTVIGGELNKDRNIYLYLKDKKGNYTIRGKSIGISTSTTSFYNSDKQKWAIGSTIDACDDSGDKFLTNLITNKPSLFNDYMSNARTGQLYDFKYSNGTVNTADDGKDIYRGMPIGITGNGQIIFTSARDVGNIAAGYIAGINGMSWKASRIAFDAYQSKSSGKPTIEGISTRNAEYYGWRIGSNIKNYTPDQKATNLMRSIVDGLKAIGKYLYNGVKNAF